MAAVVASVVQSLPQALKLVESTDPFEKAGTVQGCSAPPTPATMEPPKQDPPAATASPPPPLPRIEDEEKEEKEETEPPAPVQAAVEEVVAAVAEEPIEVPVKVPGEVPVEAPVEAPVETPKEVAQVDVDVDVDSLANKVAEKALSLIESRLARLESVESEIKSVSADLLAEAVVHAHESAAVSVLNIFANVEAEMHDKMVFRSDALGRMAAASAAAAAMHPFEHQAAKISEKVGEMASVVEQATALVNTVASAQGTAGTHSIPSIPAMSRISTVPPAYPKFQRVSSRRLCNEAAFSRATGAPPTTTADTSKFQLSSTPPKLYCPAETKALIDYIKGKGTEASINVPATQVATETTPEEAAQAVDIGEGGEAESETPEA